MNISTVLVTVAFSLILTACGGGGTSAGTAGDSTLSGIAASGAPMENASLTLTCGDGSTKTATTNSNGSYSVSLANCGAPYVISVTGMIGNTNATLVSVQATAPAPGSTLTVNTTPLTHAIAATLASSGDPLDLATNFATECCR